MKEIVNGWHVWIDKITISGSRLVVMQYGSTGVNIETRFTSDDAAKLGRLLLDTAIEISKNENSSQG